ncbi:MAG: 50S ribosomal protein L35 [Clostridiales bacterium]|nr:50S ribosomal protein L35 [Clostridiales bacterium]
MGKIRTHKASAKRFSVTGSGKVKAYHSGHRHNLDHSKSQKRKRHLRSSQILSPAMTANIKRLIGQD